MLDSPNWLRNFSFCCFFFRIETILESTVELNNGINESYTNEQKMNINQETENKAIQIVFGGNFFSSALFFVVSSPWVNCRC